VKKLWLKKKLLGFLAITIAVGAASTAFVGESRASDETEQDKKYLQTRLFLLRDTTIDTANERILSVALRRNERLTVTTGYLNVGGVNKPRCGSKCTESDCGDLGLDADTAFPVANTYYGGFTLILNTRNIRESRIPRGIYFKADRGPNPGKLFRSITLLTDAYNDGRCYETDLAGQTFTYRKYSSEEQ
jgi:hypothetical protein